MTTKYIIPTFNYQCEFMSNIKIINLTIEIPESERNKTLNYIPFTKKRSHIGLLIDFIPILDNIINKSNSSNNNNNSSNNSINNKPYSVTIDINLPIKNILPDIRNNYTTYYPSQKNPSSLSISIPYTFADVSEEVSKLNNDIEKNNTHSSILDDFESRLTKNTEDQVEKLRQYLLESMKMNSSNKSFIVCRLCLNNIIDINSINSIKCLPSSSWTELADVWLCGCTGTSQFKGLPNEISSIRDQCLVGDTSILINTTNLLNNQSITFSDYNNINKNNNSNIIEYKLIQCKYCNQDLGLMQGDNCKLDKHRISTDNIIYNNSSNNIFSINTIETIFSSLILNESHSSAIYKFLLRSSETNQCFLKLTLQSWDTQILIDSNYNNDDDTNTEFGNKFTPIIKVKYQLLESNNSRSEFPEYNIISLPPADCFQILNLLEINHSKLSKQRSLIVNNNNNNNNNNNSNYNNNIDFLSFLRII